MNRRSALVLSGACLAIAAFESGPSNAETARSAEKAAEAEHVPIPAIEGCPRGLLIKLLTGVTDQSDAISALAIEQETLKLCRERQKLVTEIYQLEGKLRSLSEARQASERPATEPSRPEAGNPASQDEPAPHAGYQWFSIIGTPGRLRAGVTNGNRVWFVRVGDRLPGKVLVTAITSRPPRVHVGADRVPLPWRARPMADGS